MINFGNDSESLLVGLSCAAAFPASEIRLENAVGETVSRSPSEAVVVDQRLIPGAVSSVSFCSLNCTCTRERDDVLGSGSRGTVMVVTVDGVGGGVGLLGRNKG